MKITCQYCGSIYDTDQYSKCPNCGGENGTSDSVVTENKQKAESLELENNKKLLLNEALLMKNQYQDLRNKSLQEDILKKQQSRKNIPKILKGLFRIIVIGIILFAVLIFSIIIMVPRLSQNDAQNNTEHESQITNIVEDNVKTQDDTSLSDLEFNCEKAVEYHSWVSENDKISVRLFISITNPTDVPITLRLDRNNVYCSYTQDGKNVQAETTTVKSEDLSVRLSGNYIIQPGMTVEGSLFFDVPENTDLQIVFDNTVRIDIPAEIIELN